MTYQEVIDNLKPELEKAMGDFKGEMMKLRSGHLSGALIEDIAADCFGSLLPLKQLGAISSLSSRQLLFQLWDKSYVAGVVKAIEQENLGLSVRIDGEKLYLTSPPLSEESRENILQVLNKRKEEAFQDLRRLRDKAWKNIQDGFQSGQIREDDKYKGKEKLDEISRDYREKIEKMAFNKEKEIKG